MATQRCWPRSSGRSRSTDGGPPTSAPSSPQPARRRHHDRPVRHSCGGCRQCRPGHWMPTASITAGVRVEVTCRDRDHPTTVAGDLTEGLKRLKMAAMRQLAPVLLVTAKTQQWKPEELIE